MQEGKRGDLETHSGMLEKSQNYCRMRKETPSGSDTGRDWQGQPQVDLEDRTGVAPLLS